MPHGAHKLLRSFHLKKMGMRDYQEGPTLALLDGDASRGAALRARLQRLGHACSTFPEAGDLILALSGGQRFALLLVVLQDEASLGILSAACQVLGIPVLVVVSDAQWGHLSSRARGFEASGTLGADVSRMTDAELDWLLRAMLQRKNNSAIDVPLNDQTVWGDYHFYEGSRHVLFKGRNIRLQPLQFGLALHLFRNLGRAVKREWFWEVLWLTSVPGDGKRALDVCVSNVRRRLELNGEHGFFLRAVYGQGYQLVEAQFAST
jgi:DNA-binding response OmpR family regulator